jgi:hypothetical protein
MKVLNLFKPAWQSKDTGKYAVKSVGMTLAAATVACFAVSIMFSGCNTQPHIKVISATIEKGIATSGGITQTIEGYRPVRIDFIIYGFRKLPSVNESVDYKAVSEQLVDFAHCYQNGVELKRSYYYHYEEMFKKGKQCKITAFYQVPDDGIFGGLSFKFNLEGFSASYDGKFTNNVK